MMREPLLRSAVFLVFIFSYAFLGNSILWAKETVSAQNATKAFSANSQNRSKQTQIQDNSRRTDEQIRRVQESARRYQDRFQYRLDTTTSGYRNIKTSVGNEATLLQKSSDQKSKNDSVMENTRVRQQQFQDRLNSFSNR